MKQPFFLTRGGFAQGELFNNINKFVETQD
jgi:hypothetical protein